MSAASWSRCWATRALASSTCAAMVVPSSRRRPARALTASAQPRSGAGPAGARSGASSEPAMARVASAMRAAGRAHAACSFASAQASAAVSHQPATSAQCMPASSSARQPGPERQPRHQQRDRLHASMSRTFCVSSRVEKGLVTQVTPADAGRCRSLGPGGQHQDQVSRTSGRRAPPAHVEAAHARIIASSSTSRGRWLRIVSMPPGCRARPAPRSPLRFIMNSRDTTMFVVSDQHRGHRSSLRPAAAAG